MPEHALVSGVLTLTCRHCVESSDFVNTDTGVARVQMGVLSYGCMRCVSQGGPRISPIHSNRFPIAVIDVKSLIRIDAGIGTGQNVRLIFRGHT